MKVTVLAATGRTGTRLVQQGLEAGHEVTAFARHPSHLDIKHENLRVAQGDVQHLRDVEEAVRGRDAVVSGLGPTPSSAEDVMTTGATHVVQAMAQHGVERLVWLTGAGVVAEGDEPSLFRRAVGVLLDLFSPAVYEDSKRAFEVIRDSDLAWTVVRVPRLKAGPPEGGYRPTFKPPGFQAISRADVAEFMIDQLDDDRFVQRAPMLTR
jgi:putative NADH-flavin reductase